MRRRLSILIGAILAGFLLAAPAATAFAADLTAPASAVHAGIDGSDANVPTPELPFDEWKDATGKLHSRLDGSILENAYAFLSRYGTQQSWMGSGNSSYDISLTMVEFATGMDIMRQVGAAADKAAASIGSALVSGPGAVITVALVAAAILALIWRQARSAEKPWGRAAQMLGVVGILAVMAFGANASTGTGDQYKPGPGSPGWVVTTVNDAIGTMVEAPAASIATAMNPAASGTEADANISYCASSVATRTTAYMNATTGNGHALPAVLGNQWLNTGGEAWKAAQFGAANPYADEVYCHLLDWFSNKPAKQQWAEYKADMLVRYGTAPSSENGNKGSLKSVAWGSSDNVQNDRSLIAWAACEWNGADWTVRPGWDKKPKDADSDETESWIKPADCVEWWTDDDRKIGDVFNVDGKGESVDEKATTPEVRDYLLSLHGTDTSGGVMAIQVFGVASALQLIIFGGFSVAIILAKVFGVVLTISILFILLASLASKNAPLERLAGQGKFLLGTSVLAAGASMFLAVIVLLTDLLARFGTETDLLGPPGSPGPILWAGLAPILACVALHLILTKALKLPSVFKPSAAAAWGQAAGAAGSAALGGFAGSAIGRRIGNGGRALGRSAVRAAGQRIGLGTGGRGPGGKGRRGAMALAGAAGAGAAAGTDTARTRAEAKRLAAEAKTSRRTELRQAMAHKRGIDPAAVTTNRARMKALNTSEGRRALAAATRKGAMTTKDAFVGAFEDPKGALQWVGAGSADAIRSGRDKLAAATGNAIARGGKYMVSGKPTKAIAATALLGGAAAVTLGPVAAGAAGAVVAGGLAVKGIRHVAGTRDRHLDRQNQVVDTYRAHLAEVQEKAAEAERKKNEPAGRETTAQSVVSRNASAS